MTSIPADTTTTTAASPTAAPGTAPKAPSPLSAVGGALPPPHHGKTNAIPPLSGKAAVQPAVPSMSGPAIVSSSNVANGAPGQSDHSRRPSSFTISAQGSTAYMPNGGSAGPNNRPPISFGSMDGSPAVANSVPHLPHSSSLATPLANPAPARSPSPIPQPAGTSGGRPPPGLQGSQVNFGSMPNTDGVDQAMRAGSIPQGPGAQLPQPQHLRRESSQSAHSDMGAAANRAFAPPNGRGRPFYPSPSPNAPQLFRNMMPQQRSTNPPTYPTPLPMRPPHAGSPYPANRSPAMPMQQPHLNGPPLQPQSAYGGYPQQFNPQQTQSIYGMHQQQLDPAFGYYPHFVHPGMPPGIPYQGAPPSPRPYATQQPYMPGPYTVPPPQVMSRTSSQGGERPGSTVGAAPSTPGVPTSASPHTPAPDANSPAPQTSNFTRPSEPRKSKAIAIKRPDGTEVNIAQASTASPPSQPSSRGPTIVSSSTGTPSIPTPPPPPTHTRTESQHVKTADERKQEFTEQFKKQLEAEKAEEKRKEEDGHNAGKTTEEAELQPKEEEAAVDHVEEKAEPDPKSDDKSAEDDEMERMIAELEAQDREREERERQYQEKKKKEADEKARQEAEAKANLDDELRRREREAEELEEAREKEKAVDEESAKLFASLKRPTFGPAASTTPDSGASTPAAESPVPQPVQPVQIPPPAKAAPSGSKPKPAALKLETTTPVEPAQPTAGMRSLESARFLHVLNETVIYPEGIKSPNPAINQTGKARGRKYDKEFLLQFQDVFKEKPSIDWDRKIKDTLGDGPDSSRTPSTRTPSMGTRQTSRPSMPGMPGGTMGSFVGAPGHTRTTGTTSEQRFLASTQARGGPVPNPFAQFGGRPGAPFPMGAPMMTRTSSSQSIPQQASLSSPRNTSSRGKGSRRGGPSGPSAAQEAQLAKTMPLTAGQQLRPLEVSNTGWKPTSLGFVGSTQMLPGGHMPPDVVQRKVKASLNKMTPEKFAKISGDILTIAMQSKDEPDGRTLRQVIQLTFEKACDEAHWAEMYAKFCKRMLEEMSPEIKDENVRDKTGQPVVGGALFRKYLLNRCQEEFERGWEVNLPEKPEGGEEAAMLSDEYYIAAAAKRRGLGLIHFIGELYKLDMLTIRIMHECVIRLLNFEGLPDESAVESLTKLLRTVGAKMEQAQNGPAMLDTYFERIRIIMQMDGLPSRLFYMLLDTVDLRKANWRSKDDAKGPKTISQIREDALAQQVAAEAERARQSQRGPRPQVGRGDARTFSGGGMMPPPDYPRNQVGIDDLKKLTRGARQTGSTPGNSLGPTSMLGSRSSSGRKGGLGPLSRGAEDSGASSRTNTPPVKDKESTASANQYSALAGLDASGEGADNVASPPSAASSPPVVKSHPAIASAATIENDNRNPGTTSSS